MTNLEPLAGPQIMERTTIRQLVEAVGAPTLHIVASPSGLDVGVATTVLLDVVEPLAATTHGLLLVSGLRSNGPDALGLLTVAEACGFVAVVIKRRGDDVSAFVAEATRCRLAVLVAADEVSWRHLDALLLSALGAGSPSPLSGDELFALANAIANVIGGSVAIEDLDRRVLAYSSLADQRIDHVRQQGILDRRVPDADENQSQYRRVFAATGVVRFPQLVDELARAAIAIKAGAQPLGTIWAIEGEAGLDLDGEQALVEGALRAALQILRRTNTTDLKLKLDESTLQHCFDGSLTGHEAMFRLSLPRGSELVLLGFALAPTADGDEVLVPPVAAAILRHVGAYRPDAVMAATPTAVYLLLPSGGTAIATRFAEGAIGATRREFGGQLRIAVGEPSIDASSLASMRREVDDILRVTTVQSDLPHVARLAQVHARVLLARVADELVHSPRLRHPGVDAMCAYDLDHGTSYCASVTAWLDHVGDIGVAAAALHVHPNTLRYRLRRAAELFDIALDHPDDRLAAWLQLRLAESGRPAVLPSA